MDDKKYTGIDPRGYTITLSSKRYEEHIVNESGHTDVPPEDIMNAVKSPAVIYQSSFFPSRDVYFAKTSTTHPPLYVKVAAEMNEDEKSGDVVTSFLSKEIGGGIDGKKGPKYVNFSNKI